MNRLLEEKSKDIKSIAAGFGAKNVRVFGSMARDEVSPDSDVDILVELEEGHDLLDIIAIKQELEELLGRQVDVVTEASVSPYIRDEVLRQAVAL